MHLLLLLLLLVVVAVVAFDVGVEALVELLGVVAGPHRALKHLLRLMGLLLQLAVHHVTVADHILQLNWVIRILRRQAATIIVIVIIIIIALLLHHAHVDVRLVRVFIA